MRGGVHLLLSVSLTLLLTVQSEATTFRCNDRTPEGRITPKISSENKFQIKISGNPSSYVPGEKYQVSLQGVKQYQAAQKFTGFFLTVHSADEAYGNDREGEHRDVGYFQTWGDALSQISESCPNAVTQTSNAYKSEIEVFWNAPASGSGCIIFRQVKRKSEN